MNPLHSSAKKSRRTITELQNKIHKLETKTKKQEEIIRKLQKSESLAETIFNNIFTAIVTIDTTGCIQHINQRFEKLSGYSREEIIGTNFLRMALPEDIAESRERFNKLLTGELRQYQIEKQWIRKDGCIIWTDMLIASVRDDQGRVQMIATALTDITSRKEIEKALEKSEAKYRELVQNANSIILRFDTNGCITFFNEFAQHFFGYDKAELMGKKIIGTIVPETDSSGRNLQKLIEDLIQSPQQHASEEYESICRDGKRVWIFWTHRPLTNERGKLMEILSVGNDITHRRAIEAQLRESEKKLRENEQYLSEVLDIMKTGVMIVDLSSNKILDVNRHAASMAGLSKNEIINRAWRDFFHTSAHNECRMSPDGQEMGGIADYLMNASGPGIPIIKSTAKVKRDGRLQLIKCFTDIRVLKKLLDEQEIDIHLAKKLLSLINGPLPRHIKMDKGASLFACAYAVSCHKEGGDHFFLKGFNPTWIHHRGRTMISLKDQSGHQVGCILRSIITDLIHQTLMQKDNMARLEDIISHLNTLLIRSGIFRDDDFLTAVNCEIDHSRMALKYISCGHPRFIMIREKEVMLLPPTDKREGVNPPLGVFEKHIFSAGEILLQKGDKIIFYTDGLLENLARQTDSTHKKRTLSPKELKACLYKIVTRSPSIGVEALLELLKYEKSINSQSPPPEDDVTIIGIEIEDAYQTKQETWFVDDIDMLQHQIDHFICTHRKKWIEKGFSSIFRLQICFEEGIANAWRHGNRKRGGRPLIIRHRYGNDFHIDILDGGAGFDLSSVPDPRTPNSRLETKGRGVFLMSKYADHIKWNALGNHLSMIFQKQPLDKSSLKCGDRRPFYLWENDDPYVS